jgi:hypothetical protein
MKRIGAQIKKMGGELLAEAQSERSTAETAVATKRNGVAVAPALCAGFRKDGSCK